MITTEEEKPPGSARVSAQGVCRCACRILIICTVAACVDLAVSRMVWAHAGLRIKGASSEEKEMIEALATPAEEGLRTIWILCSMAGGSNAAWLLSRRKEESPSSAAAGP